MSQNKKKFKDTVLGSVITKLIPGVALKLGEQVPVLGDVVKAIKDDAEASEEAKAEALSLIALEQEDRISAREREAQVSLTAKHWFFNGNFLMNSIGVLITLAFCGVMLVPFIESNTMTPEMLDFIEENRILVGNLMMGIVGYYWGASHKSN